VWTEAHFVPRSTLLKLWVEWYYSKNNYLTLRSKVKVPRRSLRYVTHRLMVMHPHNKYHWPISKDKNVMAQTRKYYLKNNYLTSRSKVKIPRRSLRYVTHHLMVMHSHTLFTVGNYYAIDCLHLTSSWMQVQVWVLLGCRTSLL
jgi:hypothetical protein